MKKEMINAFLGLHDFAEYLSRLEEFIGLPIEKETFRKEMELLETDKINTHREKEQILQKRKKEIVKRLQSEMEDLCEEVRRNGPYSAGCVQDTFVNIVYLYPDGKRGDINHAIAKKSALTMEMEEDIVYAAFPENAIKELEWLLFPARNLFSGYDFTKLEEDRATMYLMRINRILQIEYRMWKVNYLIPNAYRSLRSVPDKSLRDILQTHHRSVEAARDRIYETLIEDANTHAKWISEQKAYAIVKSKYPDARFQYQAEWLQGQRLDIFIPSQNVGIEYQGRQHTEAVEFFGGEAGLKNNIERDRRKKYRCLVNGVELIYWSYDQPLTEEFFTGIIVPQIELRKPGMGQEGGITVEHDTHS